MDLKNLIFPIVCLLMLSGCSKYQLMTYYYPILEHQEDKYYKYTNPTFPNSKKLRAYSRFTINPKDTLAILTTHFDTDKKKINITKEKISNRQIELLGYAEYEESPKEEAEKNNFTQGRIQKEASPIVKNKMYTSKKLEAYSYSVELMNAEKKLTLEKKRKFIEFKTIRIKDKKYKTAKFKDEYIYYGVDPNDDSRFEQISYYAEGIGLVRYERVLDSGEVRILELTKVLSKEEFKNEVVDKK